MIFITPADNPLANKLSDSLTVTIGRKSQGSLLGLYGNKM